MDQGALQSLVAAIVRGDAKAERTFFEYFRQEVEFFVRLKIGRHNMDWEDLRQEIFIALFKRMRDGAYDAERGSVGAFIHSTMKFKIMDYLKSRQHHQRTLQRELAVQTLIDADDPEQRVIHHEQLDYAATLLGQLPEPHRSILADYYVQGLPVHEIAAKQGLTAQKVSNYKSYALSLLQIKCKKTKYFRFKV